ncbi:hypothetical protein DFH06DRAFT_1134335 [Mycena polygramma]|nr:hypothetical protein DFH06DRAFT_1134335 [Mycena polygramma]
MPVRVVFVGIDSGDFRWITTRTDSTATGSDHAPEAAVKVQAGFKQIQEMVDAGNATAIAQTLAVCTPPKKEERDSFLRDLAGIFGLMLQSDAQYVASTLNLTGFPWNVVANRTLAAASPLAAVNETINAMCFSQIATNGCFDWTQQCSDAAGTQTIPFDYLKPYCEKTFNVTPPTKRELFDKYHFDEATIRKFPRVIYSQGGADPVRGIAPDEKWFEIAPTDPNAPRYLFADYATHTQDIITSLIIGNNDSSLMRPVFWASTRFIAGASRYRPIGPWTYPQGLNAVGESLSVISWRASSWQRSYSQQQLVGVRQSSTIWAQHTE